MMNILPLRFCHLVECVRKDWGEDVQVGVTTEDNSLLFVALKEMQPHHWCHAYPPEELEHYEEG